MIQDKKMIIFYSYIPTTTKGTEKKNAIPADKKSSKESSGKKKRNGVNPCINLAVLVFLSCHCSDASLTISSLTFAVVLISVAVLLIVRIRFPTLFSSLIDPNAPPHPRRQTNRRYADRLHALVSAVVHFLLQTPAAVPPSTNQDESEPDPMAREYQPDIDSDNVPLMERQEEIDRLGGIVGGLAMDGEEGGAVGGAVGGDIHVVGEVTPMTRKILDVSDSIIRPMTKALSLPPSMHDTSVTKRLPTPEECIIFPDLKPDEEIHDDYDFRLRKWNHLHELTETMSKELDQTRTKTLSPPPTSSMTGQSFTPMTGLPRTPRHGRAGPPLTGPRQEGYLRPNITDPIPHIQMTPIDKKHDDETHVTGPEQEDEELISNQADPTLKFDDDDSL